ncbi:MAG: hypothetical protein C0456_04025 [Hyphomonas sp.]|uniref:hypothetical protein n=1 Tax=Hyphomonas sp. TaxID=87 RepID=UPI001D27BA58|nr:hypothetical protein [Hyphomonas sp.]MBA4225777.1 hypothetical protein [Hyphomonas sp.]
MTDVSAPSPPKRTKHVNTQATCRSLRHLAREWAERGERLADIGRRLKIAPSTIHLWARQDGFRRKDIRARASLAHGPALPDKADYPELKELAPRARLERLGELSGEARLRAVAAIEEGYLDYGLKWLREAQKLERGHKALKEHLEHYPPPEEEAGDDLVSRGLEALEEMVQAEKEGRAPVFRELTPEQAREAAEDGRIWDAIEDARVERMTQARDGRAPEEDEMRRDRLHNLEEDTREYWRLKEEVKKWRLFPGRGDPPPLRAVSRGRSILPQPEPEIPGGKKLYGMEEAFPVKFTRRE